MFVRRALMSRAALVRPLASVSGAAARTLVRLPKSAIRPIAFSSPQPLQSRWYSVLSQCDAKLYGYNDVKQIAALPESFPNTVLVDVREPVEFQEGHIPGALNVPFKSSPGAFDLAEEDFEESFGFPKPAKDQELVFYCLGGVRSTAAEELANSFGYTKRGNYVGSWEDWVSQENAARASEKPADKPASQ